MTKDTSKLFIFLVCLLEKGRLVTAGDKTFDRSLLDKSRLLVVCGIDHLQNYGPGTRFGASPAGTDCDVCVSHFSFRFSSAVHVELFWRYTTPPFSQVLFQTSNANLIFENPNANAKVCTENSHGDTPEVHTQCVCEVTI